MCVGVWERVWVCVWCVWGGVWVRVLLCVWGCVGEGVGVCGVCVCGGGGGGCVCVGVGEEGVASPTFLIIRFGTEQKNHQRKMH